MTLAGGDLTTLTTLQAYLPGTSAPSATVLSGLITRISRSILTHLNRSFIIPKDYVQRFNGSGTRSLVLPNWPVLSLDSVTISGGAVTLIGDDSDLAYQSYGIRIQDWDGIPPGDPAVLEYAGGYFTFGSQNVVVSYRAGYKITDEARVIPATSEFRITPLAPYGIWATDEGVTYDDGTALTAISTGTPLAGQYLPPNPDAVSSARTYYTFNASDAERAVLLSYGFVPADLEQAVLEFVMERSAYRSRPGIKSQTLASQETIVYNNSSLSRFVDEVLMGYKSVLPPAIGASV